MYSLVKKIITKIVTWQAKFVLKKYKPKIITVSGNVGKTSTKDAIYKILKDDFYIRKSEKSYNSDLGVPLTILGLNTAWKNPLSWFLNIVEGFFLILFPHKYPDWLVLEIGADRPGDIKKIATWLKPNIAVVTKIPDLPVHVEFFSSPEELFEEKVSIAKKVDENGFVTLNNDQGKFKDIRDQIKGKVFFYGQKKGADLYAYDASILYKKSWKKEDLSDDPVGIPCGMSFKIKHQDQVYPVNINNALGFHHIDNILAACSVALVLGQDLSVAISKLNSFKTPPGRMTPIEGIKKTIIIDDTYNSSPVALESALVTLAIIKSKGRKIAVLGDMLELGTYTMGAHKKLGEVASAVCDEIYLVGIRSKFFAEGALSAGFKKDNIHILKDSVEAGKLLQSKIKTGDIILFKGSQSIRLEKAVLEIMAHPESKNEVLVRQESEWKHR